MMMTMIMIRLVCIDCGILSGEKETLDDGFEVDVMIRRWDESGDQQLCLGCYVDLMSKRGKLPQFGELKG